METKKTMCIDFSSASSTLLDVIESNPSFDAGKLRIAYTGKNRNNTFISKESFEKAIPSMFNCPIVANYMREIDEIGSHDGEFVKGSDGEIKYVNTTEPVGLVPESATWHWETVEDNGVMHQYLCTDVVLWKRQEAYEKIKDNGVTDQSMEIEVNDAEMLDDYYNIKDFTFTAFCLLGTAEPCFESASLMTFANKYDFKKQYTEMLKDFKMAFASAEKFDEKEAKESLKLNELLEKHQVKLEDLDFEYESLSDEELETKFTDMFEATEADGAKDENALEVEDEPEDDESSAEDFALNSQLCENLWSAIEAEQIEAEWGSYSRYYMVDYDTESNEVYFRDSMDGLLYGCVYAIDGDDVSIDFTCKKRKKYQIVDYIEGANASEYNVFEQIIDTFTSAYYALNETIAVNTAELERLTAFEADVLAQNREAQETELFARFEEKLNGNEDYMKLKETASEYEIEALERELYAICGRLQFALETTNNSKPGIIYEDKSKKDPMRQLFAWKDTEEK